jgi:hypothetical protein
MTEQAASKKAERIEPEAYPQMVNKRDGLRAMQTLQSAHVALKAQTAMNSYTPMLRDAIMDYVEGLEEAGTDMTRIFAMVHEIRNFGENAGMTNAGRIAEVLCRYMDEMERLSKPVDSTIVGLHVAAIARAARAEEEDLAMGKVVAAQLDALVKRRLAEAGVP